MSTKLSTKGARAGILSGFRRLVSAAMAAQFETLVVPGPEIARAHGLDLARAGLRLAATPRHAGVLLIIGPLGAGLRDAVSVAYAQMPRPRAILALGAGDISPLPAAEVEAELSQEGLRFGLAKLRKIIGAGAFIEQVSDFSAPALETRIEYTCPMHPEVISDKPGNCPKCGMTLVERTTEAGGGHGGHKGSADDGGDKQAAAEKKPVTGHTMAMQAEKAHGHSMHGMHGGDEGHHPAAAEPGQYTCPMHPEVVSDSPGQCPKCGMNLEPVGGPDEKKGHTGHAGHEGHAMEAGAESTQYTCPMHPEVVSDQPGNCPKCGMNLVERSKDTGHDAHGEQADEQSVKYTCPMHPEVVSDQPGNCPKCGMNLVERSKDTGHGNHEGHGSHQKHEGHGKSDGHVGQASHAGHASMDHSGMDHSKHQSGEAIEGIEPQFMSMAELTKGTPRSSDGLQMEWIKVPYGPFFPGLPGGLGLDLTLDGDNIAGSETRSLVGRHGALVTEAILPADFVARIAETMPLAPVSYGLLAIAAIESAGKITPEQKALRARAGALERERIASHLSWLSALGVQSGFSWAATRAGSLQLKVQRADAGHVAALAPVIISLLRRIENSFSLRARLGGVALLDEGSDVSGPLARAMGRREDARISNKAYAGLGFKPIVQNSNDALARMRQRCAEIVQSLDLIAAAGEIADPVLVDLGGLAPVSGTGMAEIETPRGTAVLRIDMVGGRVEKAELETPSARHLALVETASLDQELGDGLAGIASLDLSPWEIGA